MKKNTLIAVIGLAGAGKTEVTQYLVKQYGFSKIWFGGVVVDGVKALGQEINQDNERKFRENLRKKHGMAGVAVKVFDRIVALRKETDKVLLESLYSWEEYLYLKKRFPELLLVCVYSRPKTRYARLKKREFRPMDEETTRERDKAQIENLHQGGPIAIADFLVINEGSLDEMYKELDKVMEMIDEGDYWEESHD